MTRPRATRSPYNTQAAVISLALATAIGAAGCSSSKTASTAPSTTPPASTATPAPTPSSPSTPPAPSPSPTPSPTVTLPSNTTLQAALLAAADLGPTFTQTSDTSSGNAAFTGCKPLADLLNSTATAPHQVTAEYQAGSSGPYVNETLTAGTAADLQAAYNNAKTALTSCKTVTFTSGGTTVVFGLTPINFGGPNSAAVRMDGTVQGVELNGYLVIDQIPSALLGFFYFQATSGSSQIANTFHTKAVTKAQQTLTGTPAAQPTPS